ncbi:MAG: preprotein translocase subunit YajC [Ignavibacteria bacterium]|nr:preprotein translocase subunit YajC [Ignavibacteria bacterium]
MLSTLIMFAAIFLIMYFLMIRPQQKRMKEREKMLSELKKGDKVVMSSGIYGVITQIDDRTVIVQVADNVKLKFEKSAVATVLKD